ncbi:hypothetical protein [Aequorivita lipolytica]|uniref:Uncharacterized protein n=1 Tax=Aequorivita lipolytica TaxID=153267 RepID=A0A5C6YQZ7_9FLAO|nr:hypothetical protein [Aequorivita lipolytica]TXD69873.1 hypothetical protein ESV24_05400 [Aequorivita lipolytica]SRX50308.1 hypothetical protein AEQU2_00780 [Aequorivita lipolytica]
MEEREEMIQEQMRSLVTISCDFDIKPNKAFQNFHKSLLKFYFNAIDVNIDYSEKLISIWNPKPLTTNPLRLYDLNEALADKVIYTNLEETLNGCLEIGQLQNSFYIRLLSEYEDSLKGGESFLGA